MNNGGWSLNSMIGFCFIFLFSLTLSAVIYNKNFSTDETTKNLLSNNATSLKSVVKSSKEDEEKVVKDVDFSETSEYEKLEKDLEESSLKYFKDNSIITNNYKIIVSLNELKESGYIDDLKDPENNSNCNGYVVFNGETTNSYIKCMGTYQTDNYNKEFE